MANIVLDNLKTLYLNGKQIKRLDVQGKQVKMSYNISFNTNMANYYYISGQGGAATTVAAPPTQIVPVGSAIGTLPTLGTSSSGYAYTLSGYTYTVYVTGWYTESSLTNQVTTSWVPSGDAILYAKWAMTGHVYILNGATSTSTVSFTVPKFASGVYWYCVTNGGNRLSVSKTCSGTTYYCSLVHSGIASGRNSNSNTFTSAGGSSCSVTQYGITVGSSSVSVSVPSNGSTQSANVNLKSTVTKSSSGKYVAGNSSFGLYVRWTAPNTSTGRQSVYARAYYGGNQQGDEHLIGILVWSLSDGDPTSLSRIYDVGSTSTYTYASGNSYVPAAAWGKSRISSGSEHTVSVTAASGTGYSRTVRVNA